jgi:hypothetical protein
MAFGFGKIGDLAKQLDRDIPSAFLIGAIKSAERTISELQKEGPSWSGRFGNSWQVEGPQGQLLKGSGAPGEAQPLKFKDGPFTGRQAVQTLARTQVFKDKTVFIISNFSDHVAEATDKTSASPAYYKEGWKLYPKGPNTQQGKENFDFEDSGRKKTSRRGEIGGGNPKSTSSRTAPLDWFSTFEKGGRVDKAVRIEMDRALRRFLK